MGDRMHVELVVGPLTQTQMNGLPDVMDEFLRDLGLEYQPEILESDSSRVKFVIEEANYGIQCLEAGNGRLQFLIDESIPYRVTDDGGAYQDGTDATWHPNFGEEWVLRRVADSKCRIVLSESLIDLLQGIDYEGVGRLALALTRTDPSDPELAEAFQFIRYYLPRAGALKSVAVTAEAEGLNDEWHQIHWNGSPTDTFEQMVTLTDTAHEGIRIITKDGEKWISFEASAVPEGHLGDVEELSPWEVSDLLGVTVE